MSAHFHIPRSLFKLIYRHTHSRAMRHSADFCPWLRVTRNDAGQIARLAYRQRNIALLPAVAARGKENGAAHIVATGPSLSDVSTATLNARCAIGVNGAFHRTDVRFRYYAIIDRGFAHRNRAALLRLLEQGTHLFTTPFCLHELLQENGLPADAKLTIIEQFNEHLYRPMIDEQRYAAMLRARPEVTVFRDTPLSGFSRDAAPGIFGARTVTYTALQIAVHLGFGALHFFGLDMKISAARRRFYETGLKGPRSSLELNFAPHILPAFTGAAAFLRKAGVRLINHSPDSAFPDAVIPKALHAAL